MASTLEKAKYQRIAQSLREQIRSGELQPGDRLPSFSEMHTQHGATTTTVERSYTILQQEGLVKREKGRGVFVAQPKATRANGVIGIVGLDHTIATVSHPWSMHLLAGIREAAGQANKELLLYHQLSNSTIKWEQVDGVLNLEPYGPNILPHLPIGMPFVSALTRINGTISVAADEAGGIRQAIEHFLTQGHRRIGYLITHASPKVPFLRPRIAAYQDALSDAGIESDMRWLRHLALNGSPSYQEHGYNNMVEWLADDWHELGCTALLAQNDDTAIGAMQALQEAGIRIPGDVSVIGFDGTEIGKYCTPHLTSVAMPLHEIGRQAMELLLRQIQEEPLPMATIELPTHLEVRASTKKITAP